MRKPVFCINKITEKSVNVAMGIIIVVLCIYVASRCIGIITKDKAEKKEESKAVEIIQNSSKMLAKEIIENSSVINQYMVYIENHASTAEVTKKKILASVVKEYISHSEYTYDTSDPAYEQVVDLIYENVERKEECTTQPPTTVAKVETAANTILVPMPKLTGTKYNIKNLKTFANTKNKFYTITKATSMKATDLNLSKALKTKFKIKGSNDKPQILVYHTHSQEAFSNSTGDKNTTIIGVGNRLTKVLEKQFGYNVIHDKTKYDIVDGKLDRNKAYDQAREGVKKILKDNPSISLVLDIHRDGVNEDTHLVTEVNGKKTAQIMFFNGMSRFRTSGDIDYLYNPYLFENLALSLQMKIEAEAYYPGFTRRNYVNAYKYNLDLCRQCMLIEVGAQTNTYQEAQNAAEPLAVLIYKVLGDEKKK